MTPIPLFANGSETAERSAEPLFYVAIPVPLRRPFIYRGPSNDHPLAPGMRVLVPFGPRRLTGYVVGIAPPEAAANLKVRAVSSVLDDQPSLSTTMLEFLQRAAEYYLHPLGEVLRSALPPGIDPFEKKGELREARVRENTEKIVIPASSAIESIDNLQRKAPKRAAILAAVIARPGIPVAELREISTDASGLVKRLCEDGLVTVETRAVHTDLFASVDATPDVPPILTDEQTVAAAAIEARIRSGTYGGFLLHGITGSGKTEVYLRAIEVARSLGKGALVLVPEITLTPQLVRRYVARFGKTVAVWHSGLTDRERYSEWQKLRSGAVQMAIGVRSAVFAPLDNLGVIIVDEEHDGSFKQERGFSYSARDLSLLRASLSGAVAILGSATPSLESTHNAQIGKLALLTLTRRATERPLPEIEVIDLTRHRGGPGGQTLISGPLHKAIVETLERKEQIILFLNRRGFSPSLLCVGCGEVIRCEDCSVSMTYHTRPPALICHYCGARKPIPNLCPTCAAGQLKPIGAGTQKAEEILRDLFPEASVARLDRDVGSGDRAEEVLESLRRGEVDILVGTQMVTKGHDFPRVTLVGVLLGDVGLHMPDFRAGERTFQLLTQVAGRAGRAQLNGRAIIQTYSPSHPVVVAARSHDYAQFAEGELAEREELGYPPFGRLCALRLSSPDPDRVEETARALMADLRDALHRTGRTEVTLLGPVQAPLAFIQGRHRWQIFLKAPRQDLIRNLLREVLDRIEAPPPDVRIRLDVDPVSML